MQLALDVILILLLSTTIILFLSERYKNRWAVDVSVESGRSCDKTTNEWIELDIWGGEGEGPEDTTPYLLRKTDIVQLMGRGVPGCTVVTVQGDWYNSPNNYERIRDILMAQ
jgi:hypothetical protein